jgi:uridine kinase
VQFNINFNLLTNSRTTLFGRENLYWIVGGAGSGKTTISHALSTKFGIPVYDMDAHIYGTYHSRFKQEKHPVNWAWSTSKDGLAWLLDLSWDDFNNFNQAAIPEYLNLLSEDIDSMAPKTRLIIDGGICKPLNHQSQNTCMNQESWTLVNSI